MSPSGASPSPDAAIRAPRATIDSRSAFSVVAISFRRSCALLTENH